MPISTKSGFLSSYFRRKEPCGRLFRQILFVLQAVPDVLDIIIVFQRIQQLAHQLQLVGVGQAGGGHGHHGQIVGEDLVALLLHGLDHSRIVLGIGGDLGCILAGIEVLGTSIQSIHHSLVGILIFQRDVNDTLLTEQEAHAAHSTQIAAVLVEVVAQVGSGTVAVVGQGLHHDSNAAGAVAFVGDCFVLGLIAALSLLDDALDVIVGHAHALCLGDQVSQLAVGSRVRAAGTHGNADLAADLSKDLCLCVDLAEKALLAAHKNAVVKGDVTALENALNNMKAGKENVGAEEAPVYVEIYSARTYAAYESVMNEIREALKDKENVSEKEAQDLTAKLEKAEKALVYSSIQRELAETELENAVKYNKDDYTTVSYKAYTDAKSALDAIVKADKTERKNPKEVYTARNTFAQTEEGLVNVAALKAKLAEVGKLDENLYTKDSWKELQDAVKNAEAYLENGTKDQVDKAVSDLENAVNGLVEKTEVTVDDVIAEMEKINGKDYTEVSFGALQDAISKAKADKDQNDPALDQANITAMKEAKAALVSIVDLKAALNEAAQHKAGTYTVSSYKLLKDAVTNAEPLKVNGTKEEVANAAAAIRAAIKGLDKRAVGLDEYRDSIVLKKPEGYTEESYAAYKNAYDALMALDSKETTAEMFANAKSAFEAAQAGLVQKPGSNGTGSSSNGTVSNGAVATGDTVNVSALAGLFLSLLMIAAFMKRKTFLGFFEKDE